MNSYPGGLNHFFDLSWPSAAQIKKATSTALYLDPTNGSDNATGTSQSGAWKTGAKLAQAIGDAHVNQSMAITLLGNMPAGEELVIPNIGRSGQVVIQGSPTILKSGTCTTGTAGPTNTTQTRGQIVDSTVSSFATAGPSGSTLVNKRVRLVGGARNGALGWLIKASAANTALTQQLVLASTASPLQPSFSSTAPASGDAYVVEQLTSVPAMRFRGDISGDFADQFYKLLIADIALADTWYGSVPRFAWPPSFVGCYLGALSGSYYASACHLNSPFYVAGDYVTLQACLLTGFCYVEHGAYLSLNQGTIAQACNVIVEGGYLYGSDFAAFDCMGAGFTFINGKAQLTGLVWGSGNSTFGIVARGNGVVFYTPTKPSVTGTSGDTQIGGKTKAYSSAIPFLDVASTTADGGSGVVTV